MSSRPIDASGRPLVTRIPAIGKYDAPVRFTVAVRPVEGAEIVEHDDRVSIVGMTRSEATLVLAQLRDHTALSYIVADLGATLFQRIELNHD